MRNSKDTSMLEGLIRRIRENPKEDLDDVLFYTIMRAVWLGKEIAVSDTVTNNHGKNYLRTYLSGKGTWTPIRSVLLGFADEYVMLDGFLIEDIIIEKGFIEELISAIDGSTMTAIADDISSYETEAAAAAEESLQFYPDIRKWNAEAVLTVKRVSYDDGNRAKERLASAYRNVLEKAASAGYHTLSIGPLSDYPPSLEGDIASSAASIFFSLHPEYPMCITFVLPDEDSLSRFLMPPEHQQE